MRVFGIVNTTPDSFSDGGRYQDVSKAVDHALALVRDGADIIDVGGESTRPGAVPVRPVEEQRRILPVIEELVQHGIVVSVDTRHSQTAAAALAAGARFINDVSGGEADPLMIPLAVKFGAYYIAMHWGGGADAVPPRGAVAKDVIASLRATTLRLITVGMHPERIILDPGLGFGKSDAQNWELIGDLRSVCEIGPKVLVGHSRKRFIGSLLSPRSTETECDAASAAVSVLCDAAGVWGVRVHSSGATRRLLELAAVRENATDTQ